MLPVRTLRGPSRVRAHLFGAALGVVAVALGSPTSHAQETPNPSELPPQFAYNYGETETARAGGMAGALRAAGGAATAIYQNPANLGLTRIYHIDALGQFTPEAGRHLYGGSIVDSTRRFSGAFSFVGGFQDGEGVDRSSIDLRAALGFAISDAFHVGVAGRYLSLQQEGLGVLGDSRASGGSREEGDPTQREALVSTFNFDAGVTVRATDELHVSVVGTNLTYRDNALMPTTVGGGIAWATEDFTIEVDGLADFNSWSEVSPRVMAGGEYLIAGRVPVRLGYRFDALAGSGLTPSHQIAGGAGYLDPRFGVQAGVRRTLAGPSATTILVQAGVYLESLGLGVSQP
ncbi:MAG: hypothetical protein AAGN82_22320 [Myxococcota bacterium]